ncbi:MAG: hypothetical protein HYS81_01580 [Candidatus Aenigmatarchaeota archaeon]|nr:MAG: hypothetical protein HYS81_01580 [Candidatus Aenigmarchaeota archaeon]
MKTLVMENGKVWVGAPKLERVMGIEHGLIVLRSRDKRLLHRLAATALLKNRDADAKTFYLYAAPDFLNAYAEFITKASQDLGIDWETLMQTAHFSNFSTESPTKMEEQWMRVEENAEDTRLVVLDSVGYHAGRDAYLVDRLNRLCYYKNAIGLVLDSSEEPNPTLERLASVVVDLNARDHGGIEVFLRKHPRLPQTIFLMSG